MNLDREEQEGLVSFRKSGELVVLPMDKSGKFAIMSMRTYIKAGSIHTDMNDEIGLDALKTNQKRLNGHISMLTKIFCIGSNWNHGQRMREKC